MPFAIINVILLLCCIFIYGYFRCGVFAYCRVFRRMSKTFIRKNQKGASNFWLYTQLHEQRNLGVLYYLNFIYLVFLLLFAVGTVFSWVSVLRIFIVTMGVLLGIASIPVYCISLIYLNFEQFGKKFVIFEVYKGYNEKSRMFASAFDWLFGFLPLGIYILVLTKNVYW